MRLLPVCHAVLILAGLSGLTALSPAATVILANSPNANGQPASNANLPATFGDNVSLGAPGNAVFATSSGVVGIVGTPDIGLTWSATGGSAANAWQSHTWSGSGGNAGGGALQMDGSQINSVFSITFTPTAVSGVLLGGFNFIGDTNGDSYQYRVDVVNLATSQTVFTTTTDLWTTTTTLAFANAPSVDIGYTGDLNVAYRLDLVRIGGTGASSAVDIAIDNLRFDQVPEPSRAMLLTASLMVGAMRRRRRGRAGVCCLLKSNQPGYAVSAGTTSPHDLKGVAPEVLRFRNAGDDGVVSALAVHIQQTKRTLGIHRCGIDHGAEISGSNVVGAAECGEDAAGLQHLEGAEVDLLVAAQGIMEGLLGLGKAGRIQDDEIVGVAVLFCRLQEVEHVLRARPEATPAERAF